MVRTTVVTAAAAGLLFAAAPPARAIDVGARLPVPNRPGPLRGAADGTMRLAILGARSGNNAVVRAPARGSFGTRTVLVGPSSFQREPVTALTQGGSITAYEVGRAGPNRIVVSERTSGGTSRPPVVVSDPTSSATAPSITTGGGSVIVTYTDRGRRGDADDRIVAAIRPKGAARFLPPVALDEPPGEDEFQYAAALGREGSGAIAVGPRLTQADLPVRVRRVSARGTLGPWLQVTRPAFYTGTVALGVTGDGTVALAMVLGESVPGHQEPVPSMLTSSLPPGGGPPTPVQVLRTADGDGIAQEENLSLATGPGDETVVVGHAQRPGRIQVYSGAADALAFDRSFRVARPGGTQVAVARDGGVFVTWTIVPSGFSIGKRVVGSYRPPRGRFGPGEPLLSTRFPKVPGDVVGDVEVLTLARVGRRGAALAALDESNDRSAPFVVRLAP